MCFALVGCSKGQGISLLPYHDPQAAPDNFVLCHGFGCTYQTQVSLEQSAWFRALAPLKEPSKTAQEERAQLAQSIALIERAVQKQTGMRSDFGQAETFEKDQDQMDCLDETINSSRFLAFIEAEGLLKFHVVRDPVHRGFFVDGMWPHNSAAIVEVESGEVYAVDSYYSDNGGEVHVVALDVWLDEWRPESAIAVPKPARKPSV